MINQDIILAIETKCAEIVRMIGALKSPTTADYGIPEALIKLLPGEYYVGIVLNAEGKPSHHLVLLPGEAKPVTPKEAKEWAFKQGGDMPTQQEQALLFANLKNHFKPLWYVSGAEHESSRVYCQHFGSGGQSTCATHEYLHARAIRRLPI